ncbi:MAG: hypothetical protein OHK0012_21870 [Synechococcales cyanobacterium]
MRPWMVGLLVSPLILTSAFPAKAIFQGNSTTVTLTDVLACLTFFQNPGATLTATQLADSVSNLLGEPVSATSWDPVPTPAGCNFIQQSDQGVDLEDVVALLVVFQNPGVALNEAELIAGVNGILGGDLPSTAVLGIPGAVDPAPGITAFSPTSGRVGTLVTITGSNLAGVTEVVFNGVVATIEGTPTDTEIQVLVPDGATDGVITVITPAGEATSTDPFNVLPPPPTLTEFSPTSGTAGTVVTILGTNFIEGNDVTAVQFGGVNAATFTVENETTITATVPTNGQTGVITVVTTSGSVETTEPFTVLRPSFEVLLGSLRDPVGVAATDADTLFVSESLSDSQGRLRRVTLSTGASQVVNVQGLSATGDIIADPKNANALLVVETNAGRIKRVSTTGQTLATVGPALGSKLGGLVYDADLDQLVVVGGSGATGRIFVMDADSGSLINTITVPVPLVNVVVVSDASSVNGRAYVVTTANTSRVSQVTPTNLSGGRTITDLVQEGIPTGIVISRNRTTNVRRFYYLDRQNQGRLIELGLSGTPRDVLLSGLGGQVADLLVLGNTFTEGFVVDSGSGSNGRLLKVTLP